MLIKLWKKYKTYIISVLIALGVGGLSALLTMKNMDIMGKLIQPPLSPPSFLFPIVWTVLYTLMGISAAIIFEKREINPKAAREGLTYYAMSLVVNFVWSIIFFNLGALFIASIWLLLLIFLIVMTIVQYARVDKVAAYLQIPYLVWVLFATYLTFGIYLLNR